MNCFWLFGSAFALSLVLGLEQEFLTSYVWILTLVFCPRAYRIAKSWFSNCLCSFLDPTFMYEVLNLFKFPSVPGSLNIICSTSTSSVFCSHFTILVFWVFSPFYLVSLAKVLSTLLIFLKDCWFSSFFSIFISFIPVLFFIFFCFAYLGFSLLFFFHLLKMKDLVIDLRLFFF